VPDEDFVEKHAQRVGIDPKWMRKIMRVESGGDPNQVKGRHHGLFQLDKPEFTKHGGTGDIHDPEQNTMAAANKIAQEKLTFERRHGRPAQLNDIYMIHQQGAAGYDAHLSSPDAPAWQNEQRASRKSEAWAKSAIWGNMTPAMKAKYGSVENVTSANFTSEWASRMEGVSPSMAMAKVRARHEGIPKTEPEIEEKPKRKAKISVDEVPPMQPINIQAPAAPDISLRRPETL
jgi:hypothetical protein